MTYEFSGNVPEGTTIYAPGFLEEQPTMCAGQSCSLKLETCGFTRRYWLSRCGPEDGEEWQVYVEDLRDGRWVPTFSYRETA